MPWSLIRIVLADTFVISAWVCLCMAGLGWSIEIVAVMVLNYTELPEFSVILGLVLFIGVPSFYPLLSQLAIPYIQHNVIGRTVYAFRDLDGVVHAHHNEDWHEEVPRGIRMTLRQGGWFRRNAIFSTINSAHVMWKVVDERNGWYPIIGDSCDNFAIGDRIGMLFEIMERFPRPFEYKQHLINTEAERNMLIDEQGQAAKNASTHKEERDGLIKFLLLLQHDIAVSKQTLGRSKHAQLVRERIEAKLLDFPADLREILLAHLELEENQAATNKSRAS